MMRLKLQLQQPEGNSMHPFALAETALHLLDFSLLLPDNVFQQRQGNHYFAALPLTIAVD